MIIGATLGLIFLIINIIILIKYKYIKMIIICLPVLLWVLLSYYFLFNKESQLELFLSLFSLFLKL